MILDQYKPTIEKSDTFEEKFFSIGDYGMIFDILRSKMYSDPITSICREISCNARDSHREAKKPDEPIIITLPNDLEPYYKIKDIGVGISPDRVENIFIKFGASTKRDSNEQTGAFGIGSKVPFSYTDSFNVETIYDGIKYNYTCYIDETKVGKCAILSKISTDAANGTEIIIPVKPKDFHLFKAATESSTRHWEVKPIIKGAKLEYTKIETVVSGDGWLIGKEQNDQYSSSYYSSDGKVCLIIDGVEYPITYAQLDTFATSIIYNDIKARLYLFFKTGEVSISTNREQIHIDDKTKSKINERLEELSNDLRNNIESKIKTLPTLNEVYKYLSKELYYYISNLASLYPFDWNGITIDNNYPDLGKYATIRYFTNSKAKYYSSYKTTMYVDFMDNTKVFINDLGREISSKKDISAAFNKAIDIVQIISPLEGISYDDMVSNLHLDKYDFSLLSTLPIKEAKTRNSSGAKILVFKYQYGRFNQSNKKDLNNDANKKIICLLERDFITTRRTAIIKRDDGVIVPVYDNDIFSFIDTDKISIYGVDQIISDERLKRQFSDCILLDDYLKEQYANVDKNSIFQIKMAQDQKYEIDNHSIAIKLKKMILDTSSQFVKYIEFLEDMHKIFNDAIKIKAYTLLNGDIATDYEQYKKKHTEMQLNTFYKSIANTYPLYSTSDLYYESQHKHMAHYINLIDKEIKENEK